MWASEVPGENPRSSPRHGADGPQPSSAEELRLQGRGLCEEPDDETSVPSRYPRIPALGANYLKDPFQPFNGRTEEDWRAAQARTRRRADTRRRAGIGDYVKSLPGGKDMMAHAA